MRKVSSISIHPFRWIEVGLREIWTYRRTDGQGESYIPPKTVCAGVINILLMNKLQLYSEDFIHDLCTFHLFAQLTEILMSYLVQLGELDIKG